MESRCDVGILGGGIAGCAAALAAAAAGASVVLIRARPGATALAAGGWTTAPPAAVADALAAAGYHLAPVNAPLPHPVGDLRAAALAHEPHLLAVVEDRACVLGIAGLPGFRPRALARLWADAAGVTLHHELATLPGTPAAGWSPVSLAATLEHDPAPLADALAASARRTRAARLIVPAVLGLDRASAVRAALEHAAGVPVGEALGTPPSLPGWRLQRALDRALKQSGVRVVDAVAGAPERAGDRLVAVTAVADARGSDVAAAPPASSDAAGATHRILAGEWVLATGRFVGGGIVADPEWREPTLGTPLRLTHLGASFDVVEPLATTSPDRLAAQPPLALGLATDDDGRPADPRTGEPVHANVSAAGAVRASPLAEVSLGHAAADGWRAGSRAAERVGVPV